MHKGAKTHRAPDRFLGQPLTPPSPPATHGPAPVRAASTPPRRRLPQLARVVVLGLLAWAEFLVPYASAQSSAFSLPAPTGLVISEIVADNDGGFLDGHGDASDWIELQNLGESPIDLRGWQLRDSESVWRFPSVILSPGGFLVVFASDQRTQPHQDPAGFFHTNFALDSDGEALSLLSPDGAIVSSLPNAGHHPSGVSFGIPQRAQSWVSFESPARILTPTSPVSDAWRSSLEFDDRSWLAGQASAGFGQPFANSGGTAAYQVAPATPGNQAYSGALGMDFVVERPISVTALGCFDDGGNGLSATIQVQLWRRNDAGTPETFADDSGGSILASQSFSAATPGNLIGGSRFKSLPKPIDLTPGAYTIVASGYGASERNGNSGAGNPGVPWETSSGQGAIRFVGSSRYGAAGAFPRTIDGGPENRYAAGTFLFAGANDLSIRTVIATSSQSGTPTALMRIPFQVERPQDFESVEVKLSCDDGCVAWLNGAEIHHFNAPPTPIHASTALTSASRTTVFSARPSQLRPGSNLLAIQGLNVAIADVDMFLGATVSGISRISTQAVHFLTPTPGGPNVSPGKPGFVAVPQFSVPRGFQNSPVSLVLTSRTEQAEIRYTLDGSRPTASHGTRYSAPIPISRTTVVRAIAFREDFEPSPVVSHSYLFASDIAVQPESAPPGYPSVWTNSVNSTRYVADYGMVSPTAQPARYSRAAGNAGYSISEARDALSRSLQALPILSVSTDPAHLFHPATGIYLHPASRGDAWERPVSVEFFTADGTESWHANAGIHVMGLTSRSLEVTPKLNFMLVFSAQYGPPWLREPFFGPEGPSRIKRIALRSNTRDGWLAEFNGFGTATYIADGFAKDSALASGEPGTRHRYCHLFLNGLYWGVYNPTERPQQHWAETTFGGEDEDYDVLDLCCSNQLESGDFTEWRQLLAAAKSGFRSDAAYQSIQGNDPLGQRNPNLKRLLGVDSFIGFAIGGYYHASVDWPGNFFAAYDNVADRTLGWRFIGWDNDLCLPGFQVNANKVTPPEGFSHPWWQDSPGVVDVGLRQNAEYRLRLADRVFQEFFHEGAYATNVSLARWRQLRDSIQPGLYAESARWGDYRTGGLRTVQDHWLPRVNGAAATSWFNRRNAIVIQQLRSAGLYPPIDPPQFSPYGGTVSPGFALRLSSPAADSQIRFTLDGSDPRTSPDVMTYSNPIPITSPIRLRARVLSGATWSALAQADFFPEQDLTGFQISEIMYNPPRFGAIDGDEVEFLECHNSATRPISLAGLSFTEGIEFTFPPTSVLEPAGFLVLVRNATAFQQRHPGVPIHGVYSGRLDNGGERLTLRRPDGSILLSFSYDNAAPWPTGADNSGLSLQRMSFQNLAPLRWLAATPTPAAPLPARLQDSDADGMPDGWEAEHGLDPQTAETRTDRDQDGLSDLDEFLVGTNPLLPSESLRLEFAGIRTTSAGTFVTLRFTASPDRTYSLVGRSNDSSEAWSVLSHFTAESVQRVITRDHPIASAGESQLFRIVSPRLP